MAEKYLSTENSSNSNSVSYKYSTSIASIMPIDGLFIKCDRLNKHF